MLVLARKPQEQIRIGDHIVITILQVRGRVVRLGVEAPRDVHVVRGELAPLAAHDHLSEDMTEPDEFSSGSAGLSLRTRIQRRMQAAGGEAQRM